MALRYVSSATRPARLRARAACLAAVCAATWSAGPALAQYVTPPPGSPTPPRINPFGGAEGNDLMRHRDGAGKPCLSIWGEARAHVVNPRLFDHIVVAANTCPKAIRVQVCYLHSVDCVSMDVQGDSRKEAILGMLPAIRDFQFEYKEKF